MLAALAELEAEAGPGCAGFTSSEIAVRCAASFKPDSKSDSRAKAVRGVLKQAHEEFPPRVALNGSRYTTATAAGQEG
ncbi:hypothetical protein [Paracoccus sp. (in: a-proteobacteria)]|uniref:hypothetical protein n=1 Tax=Paracoccus sp. TaxID=267 RepID=UPI00321F8A5D